MPVTGGRRSEYGLGDVARALKLDHFAEIRTIVEKLRALAKHSAMPLPVTPRIVKGEPITGPKMIYRHSRWDAGAIDAWIDGRGPSAPALGVAPPVRIDMAKRAERMAMVG